VSRVLLALAAAALAFAAPAFGAANIRIAGVDTSAYPEVRITVVAPSNSAVPGLTENGGPVFGVHAANLGRAKSVVLAVDRSQSMAGVPIGDAIAAARAFVAAKGTADRIEVVAFGRSALALTRFSSSTIDADVALRQLDVDRRSGTALWDAIVVAARGLAREDSPGHVILVVTDGQDVSSSASFEQAVAAAQSARAAVYTVGIAGPSFTPDPLRELAARTGGEYRQVSSTAQLASLYASISQTLSRTWQLRYPTSARPGDQLRVTASIAGLGSATREIAVPKLGVSTQPSAPAASVLPASAWRSNVTPVVLALVVGLLLLLASAFVIAARGGNWLAARLEPHLGPSQRRRRKRGRGAGRAALQRIFAATEQAFANVKQFKALQGLITRADLPLLAAELLYACIGIAVILGLLGTAAGVPAVLVFALMLVGGAAPIVWASMKAAKRIKAFDNQLPDILITIAASLKAGHSFRHALQAVVDEGAEPAAKEFKRVLTETRLGRPMDEALAEMSTRIGSKNLTFVLNAVTIQRQIGGSLAGLFDMVADTVRQRQQFARKVRSLTATGRLSAYVLIGLPFVIALAVTVLNQSYMRPLWTTALGHELVGAGMVMLATGSVILKRIVSFKG